MNSTALSATMAMRRLPAMLRSAELVAMLASFLALCVLWWHRDRIAVWPSAGYFAAVCVSPIVLRLLTSRFPNNRALSLGADVAPAIYFFLWYPNLNPVADAVGQPLRDATMIGLDQRIFGRQLSVSVQDAISPLMNDVLLAAYTTHFFWPLCTGLVLWWLRLAAAFDEYLTALVSFVAINYAMYALVPVVGPRFAQASAFHGAVHGKLGIADYLDGVFRHSPFVRDCFPSGHTGCALIVLYFTWREVRWLFWVALPVLVCLIAATIAGRFHYGIDLLATIPLLTLSLLIARLARRARPRAITVGWKRAAEAEGRSGSERGSCMSSAESMEL